MLTDGNIITLIVEAGAVIGLGWFLVHRFWPKGATVTVANVSAATSNVAIVSSSDFQTYIADLEDDLDGFEEDMADINTVIKSLALRVESVEAKMLAGVKTVVSDVETEAGVVEKDVVSETETVWGTVETDAKKVETAVANEAEKLWTDVRGVLKI